MQNSIQFPEVMPPDPRLEAGEGRGGKKFVFVLRTCTETHPIESNTQFKYSSGAKPRTPVLS